MTRGEKVIAFIERYLVVPDGRLQGQRFRLLDFQKRFILDVYDNPEKTRRAILSVARKNGKTALISCLVLAHLVGPEARPNGQIVSGALSRDQAGIVYRYARDIALASPAIRERISFVDSHKRIFALKNRSEYRALAAEGKTAHGLSPVLAVLDEVGQEKGPSNPFFDAIITSQGAHDDPLLIVISTQAANDSAMLSQWIDDANAGGDSRVVCHVYTAPEDCGLDDELAWAAANPALGVFRAREDIALAASQAQRIAAQEPIFRNLFLNQRISLHSPFIAPNVWEQCAGSFDDEPFNRGIVFGGLDLSETTDLTAFCVLANWRGRYYCRSFFWSPAETLAARARADREPYTIFAQQGHLEAIPGRVLDYGSLAERVSEIVRRYNVEVIGFDSWRIDKFIAIAEARNIVLPQLKSVGQGYRSMTPAIETLENLILRQDLVHDNNPVMNMCMRNTVIVRDTAGNRKIDRASSIGRIDGVAALLMAAAILPGAEHESAHALPPRVFVL